MTQNQIAYWANVERERSNRRNEEISSAAQVSKAQLERAQREKAETDTTKAKHDIVQGYYKNTPGTDVTKLAAGTIVAKALGVNDPYGVAKEEVKSKAQKVLDSARNSKRTSSTNRSAQTDQGSATGKSSGSSYSGGGKGSSGGGMSARR